ncbi:hypothetical protein SEA_STARPLATINUM_39 [Streptomyces phage StarPlatinum]|uniref:Uncharacterized protein n=1 Tax=Streptomyces phage StarPlatinum TaxID=2283265 RepID=A0A345M8G6_9CAUD|nr:hypothetical protein HWB77_gp250 [Streptomyces phage StarPlatinum]AXH66787.1 hypothetical protein SEA_STARPLATINUM_39 [Streptomyces phage StarPlatinum]
MRDEYILADLFRKFSKILEDRGYDNGVEPELFTELVNDLVMSAYHQFRQDSLDT